MMQAADRAFLVEVRSALYRAFAALLFVGMHKLLTIALKWTIPPNFGRGLLLLDDILFCAFVIVYLYLAFDMVAVFIPIKRRFVTSEQRGVYEATEQAAMTTKMASRLVADTPDAGLAGYQRQYVGDCQHPPDPDSLSSVIGKAANLLPFSFGISAVGCTVAYYVFNVPLDQVAVVVSVPLIIGFVFVRGFVLFTPLVSDRPRTHSVPPLAFRVSAILLFVSMVGTFAMLASSPVYFWLGLRDVSRDALHVAAVGAALIVGFVVSSVLSLIKPTDLEDVLVIGFWKVWAFPRNCTHRVVDMSHPTKNGRAI